MKIIFTLLLTFFLYSLQGQIITDRPDQTESPISVPKGSLQIETGVLVENTGDRRDVLLPTTLLRIGLGNSFELRVLSEYQTFSQGDNSDGGIGDIEIGAKVWLAGGADSKSNVGWINHIKLPSGSQGFTDNEYGFSSVLSIDHDLGNSFGLGYNLGYNHTDGDNAFTYTFALGYDLNSKVGLYIEPYGEYGETNDSFTVNGGFTYLFTPNTQFDFSFGTGISDRYNFLSTGMSWLIK